MKIVLVGAQSTGKTSVMNALPNELKKYGIREVIRNMTAQDPTVHINQNGDDWSQNRFFFEYLYLFAKYPKYISDRGLLDVCAYTLWLVRTGKVSQETYEKQMYVLQDWMKTHPDVIHIYFPASYFGVVDDGYRDANEMNRQEVDQCVREVIGDLIAQKLWKGYTISDSSITDRVKELNDIIKTCFPGEEIKM
jgi:hypothetical protein